MQMWMVAVLLCSLVVAPFASIGVVAGAPQKTTVPTLTTTTTTATTMTATLVPTERPITAQTVLKGGLPGFGILVSLAAALLVVRRR